MNYKKIRNLNCEKPCSQNLNTSHSKIYLQNTYLIKDCIPTIPKTLEQTTSLKKYKSEHLAKENIQIVNKHIKNTQNHISLGNCKLKQQ